MEEQKDGLFVSEKIPKLYLKMVLPLVFSMTVTLVYNLADTFFVAKTGDTDLVAGVSLCVPLFTFLMALGNVFGQGGSSWISRLLGRGDEPAVRRVSAFCFYVTLFLGIFVGTALLALRPKMLPLMGADPASYVHAQEYYTWLALGSPFIMAAFIHSNLLRSEGMSRESMIGTVGGAVLNMILDPVLILWAGMGAKGAAVASVIGYAASDAYFCFIVRRKSRVLSVSFRDFRADGADLRQIFGVGVPSAVSNIMQSAAVILLNRFLLPYGNGAIAAMGIAHKVALIALLLLTGLTFGAQPMFGYYFGARDEKRLRELLKFSLRTVLLAAAVLSVLIFAFASPLVKIFMDDPEIVREGAAMLRWQVGSITLAGFVLLMTIVCQSIGEIPGSFILSGSRQGVLFLLTLITLRALFGYSGVLASQAAADILTAVLAGALYLFRVRKKMFRMREG